MKTKIVSIVVLGLVVAWLTGCVAQTTDSDYDDVAQAVGALVANESGGEAGSMEDCLTISSGEVPAGMTAGAEGEIAGVRGGLEYEYSVTCLDASGATLAHCDATTDSARLTVSWAGELSLPSIGYSGSIARTGDWTISGLQSGEAEFDGEGTFDVESHFTAIYRPVTRVYILDYDATYDAVKIDDLGVLRGGQVTYEVHVHAERDGRYSSTDRDLDMLVVVTFDGSGVASLVIDEDYSYEVDLTVGTVTAL